MSSLPNTTIIIIIIVITTTTTIITTAITVDTITDMGRASLSCRATATITIITTTIITASIAATIDLAPSNDDKRDLAVLFFCAPFGVVARM